MRDGIGECFQLVIGRLQLRGALLDPVFQFQIEFANLVLGAFPRGDVVDQDQGRAFSEPWHFMRCNLDVNQLTVLLPVTPLSRFVQAPGCLRKILDQGRDVFGRSNILDRHRRKFVARKSIVFNRGGVHG